MIAIVDISGGLGNQLFQCSFALYLKDLGIKVYFFDSENKLFINERFLGIKKLNFISNKLLEILKNFKLFAKFYKVVTSNEILSNEASVINYYDKLKIISFNGYFQDYEYANKYKSEIKRSLLETFEEYGNKYPNTKSNTLIHVRRSDYLDINEQLEIRYYSKAIEYCNEKITDFSFDIFTDDYEWVINQPIFNKANYVEKSTNIEKRHKKDVLGAFSNMLDYENYIIANSTFSWWAAILSYDSNTVVSQPKPFFNWGDIIHNLSVSEWKDFPR
jgi:hypothetical protein